MRKNPELVKAWIRGLKACGQSAKAESVIRKHLKQSWDSELALEYSHLKVEDKTKHLSRAEAWLVNRGDDPLLLLAVARLSMRNELWGKARSYLETSLSIKPSAEAYQLYGEAFNEIMGPKGARVIYSGEVRGFLIGEGEGAWDAVAVIEYPSTQVMLDMFRNEEYQKAQQHRAAGLVGQMLVECGAGFSFG